MKEAERSETRGAGALALRLVALLSLTAAALFGVVALGISRLERGTVDAASAYLMPGSGATIDPRIVVVFATLAGVTGLAGVMLLSLSPTTIKIPSRPTRSLSRRPLVILATGLLALLAAFLVRRSG